MIISNRPVIKDFPIIGPLRDNRRYALLLFYRPCALVPSVLTVDRKEEEQAVGRGL